MTHWLASACPAWLPEKQRQSRESTVDVVKQLTAAILLTLLFQPAFAESGMASLFVLGVFGLVVAIGFPIAFLVILVRLWRKSGKSTEHEQWINKDPDRSSSGRVGEG
ncbi:MAG: hypothetical protein EKK53_18595 [Burkholderiales bacterium]|nr:MAG: hypothetical protein EKK53_18595 [Burkholderiales bacterium]